MVRISNKKGMRGGGVPVHHAALCCCCCCPCCCLARYPAQPIIAHLLLSLVVMVVVAGLWVVVLGAGGASWQWWWWDGLCGLNEPNLGSGFGDVAHHIIYMGTCCSNWYDSTWAGSSKDKHTLLRPQEVGCLNLWKNKCFFAPN